MHSGRSATGSSGWTAVSRTASSATSPAFTLSRRHWQVLNTVVVGPTTQGTIAEALAPFWESGAGSQEQVLDDLIGRGWLTSKDGLVMITVAGQAAHAEVSALVAATRARALDGLSREEYVEVLRVLERMTLNLDLAGA